MKKPILLFSFLLASLLSLAQAPVKVTEPDSTKRIEIHGGLNLIYQGLHQTGVTAYNEAGEAYQSDVTEWFRVPAADLDLKVRIADGVNLHTSVWLSSAHHIDTYFGYGYLEVQKFDVLGLGSNATNFLNNHLMIKAGVGNSLFSTNQYYRTTNGDAKNNPFISNTMIDDFGTALFGEIYMFAKDKESFLMIGLSDFKSSMGVKEYDPATTTDAGRLPRISIVGNKVFRFNEETKLALQGAYVTSLEDGTSSQQFKNNRAGSELSGLFNQGDFGGDMGLQQRNENNFSIDATFNWKGLQARASQQILTGEHNMSGQWLEGTVNQFTFDLTYQLNEKIYLAGRYNSVGSDLESETDGAYEGQKIEFGAGYEMTKGILMKATYFNQDMTNDFVGMENGNANGFLVGLNLYF